MPRMVILYLLPVSISIILYLLKNAEPGRFTIRTASTVIEGKGFYAAIIVESRNPLLQAVIHDFEQTAEALTNGKP